MAAIPDAGQIAAQRVMLGRNLVRGRSLDDRPLSSVSAQDFLHDLFKLGLQPSLGEFTFWTDSAGEFWLFVEREISGASREVSVAVGTMDGEEDQPALKALALVTDGTDAGKRSVLKLQYATGAFFLDKGSELSIERKVSEPEFMSFVRPDIWANAASFNSKRDPLSDARQSDGIIPSEPDNGDEEVGGDDGWDGTSDDGDPQGGEGFIGDETDDPDTPPDDDTIASVAADFDLAN